MKTLHKKNELTQSTVEPEITISYCLPSDGCAEGWHLIRNNKIGSPLDLIPNPITRQKVIAEAKDLVWPIQKDKHGLQRHTVKLTTDKEHSWQTAINGTRLNSANYYLGVEHFDYCPTDGEKTKGIVTRVEFFC